MPAQQTFPSRQYRYREATSTDLEALDLPVTFEADPGAVYRFRMGRDPFPTRLTLDEVRATLHDSFAQNVLGRGRSPQTGHEFLEAIRDAQSPADRLVRQRVFVVADGGQVPWSEATAGLQREFRFLVVASPDPGDAVLYLSTTWPFDSKDVFLQAIAWDQVAGAYQFYDRRGGAWIWAGSSWDALDPDCRGQGPFDSHVNGALNMKELKIPWLHWHSMSAGIRDEVLAPGDALRNDPLWKAKESAHLLEDEIIRPGIRRWQSARLTRCMEGDRLTRLPEFMRQVLATSTVNIASSASESTTVRAKSSVMLPMGLFVDETLIEHIGLDPGIVRKPTIPGNVYRHCVQKYNVAITDGTFRFAGDTHFAFPVPEASFEDGLVVESLMRARVMTDKLAACLLMIDFPNPVFSVRREALLKYVPASASLGPSSDFAPRFVAAVEAASAAPGTPEREFLSNWALSDNTWRAAFEQRLAAFFAAIQPRLVDPVAFEPLFELAESRRREFRKRPLHEFKLTTPVSDIPADAPFLELREDGSVAPKP